MPITYQRNQEKNYVHVEWTGDITRAVLEPHFVAFFADPFVLSSGRNLTDIRQANLKITGTDFHELILRVAVPRLEGKPRRTAIVVQKADQYGTARQYGFLAGAYSTDAIFHECDSALAWLLSDNSPPLAHPTKPVPAAKGLDAGGRRELVDLPTTKLHS